MVMLTKESIIGQTYKISPDPPFSKRGIPLFYKGGERDLIFCVLTIMDWLSISASMPAFARWRQRPEMIADRENRSVRKDSGRTKPGKKRMNEDARCCVVLFSAEEITWGGSQILSNITCHPPVFGNGQRISIFKAIPGAGHKSFSQNWGGQEASPP